MPVHANSRSAFSSLQLGQRRAAVLGVYADMQKPLTDRQVKEILDAEEMNVVRPRITELITAGYLYEVDSARCFRTGKMVRRCGLTGQVSKSP